MRTNNNIFNKYIKYKTKYLNLYNLVGGAQFKIINEKNNSQINQFLLGLGFKQDVVDKTIFTRKYKGDSNFIELIYDVLKLLPNINIKLEGELIKHNDEFIGKFRVKANPNIFVDLGASDDDSGAAKKPGKFKVDLQYDEKMDEIAFMLGQTHRKSLEDAVRKDDFGAKIREAEERSEQYHRQEAERRRDDERLKQGKSERKEERWGEQKEERTQIGLKSEDQIGRELFERILPYYHKILYGPGLIGEENSEWDRIKKEINESANIGILQRWLGEYQSKKTLDNGIPTPYSKDDRYIMRKILARGLHPDKGNKLNKKYNIY
jgi:hypothetical protein